MRYDPSLSLLTVEPQTLEFMKRIQAKCRSLGLKHSSNRQSALVHHMWTRGKERVLEIDGWHGTGSWGKGKCWHTWYTLLPSLVAHDFVERTVEGVDFVRTMDGYVGYFTSPHRKEQYLAGLIREEAAIIAYLEA